MAQAASRIKILNYVLVAMDVELGNILGKFDAPPGLLLPRVALGDVLITKLNVIGERQRFGLRILEHGFNILFADLDVRLDHHYRTNTPPPQLHHATPRHSTPHHSTSLHSTHHRTSPPITANHPSPPITTHHPSPPTIAHHHPSPQITHHRPYPPITAKHSSSLHRRTAPLMDALDRTSPYCTAPHYTATHYTIHRARPSTQ